MPKAVPADASSGTLVEHPHQAGGGVPEAGAVVHPRDPAPEDDSLTGGAPGTAPTAQADQDLTGAAIENLDPAVKKQVDRIVTALRQKDAEKVRETESRLGRLHWAEELNRLTSSTAPTDRARARSLLDATVKALDAMGADVTEADPMGQVDWDTAEAYMPGISKTMKAILTQNAALHQRVGEVDRKASAAATRAAEQVFGEEVTALRTTAKAYGITLDDAAIDALCEDEEKLGVNDLEYAFFKRYRQQIATGAKTVAQQSLERRKAAALPGGSASGAAALVRPKVKDMHEAHRIAKAELGITGPAE